MPPTMRVLTPHEVWCTYCSVWFSSENCVLNALAKFCPRLWLVPACRGGFMHSGGGFMHSGGGFMHSGGSLVKRRCPKGLNTDYRPRIRLHSGGGFMHSGRGGFMHSGR
eukprot:244843-Pyramimonas_sp.AAC.1